MTRRAAVLLALAILGGCRSRPAALRIGYETNLASAPALLAVSRGDFQTAVGLPVEAQAFAAGPGVTDALLNDRIDFAYLDPVCAVGVFVRSKGRFVIVAGSALGGAGLVTLEEIRKVDDLRDAAVAVSQDGSGSDVSARNYFATRGFVSREQGGGFQIVPISNLDLSRSFRRQDVSGAWTVEPWISALETEDHGRFLVSEAGQTGPGGLSSDPTSVVVARRRVIDRDPALLSAFLRAHADAVRDLAGDRGESRRIAAGQLTSVTGRRFDDATLSRAWSRLAFSAETPAAAVAARAYEAFRIGYMGRSMPDLRKAFRDAGRASGR